MTHVTRHIKNTLTSVFLYTSSVHVLWVVKKTLTKGGLWAILVLPTEVHKALG